MGNIIIVESPRKSKTISSYLGKGYTVLSSKGHICDLATTGKEGLGIDIENGFIPNYKTMKEKEALVKSLQTMCKGKKVYLATDPDREGEAIAYHLARVLELDLNELNRIEFHEITKTAVRAALENPHSINMKMVDSQETRRMIDRILGFKLSKLLQRKIGSKSAGRVQSVALKMIVDLEKEINSFVPTSYYEMEALFNSFKLKLVELDGNQVDAKHKILNRSILETLKPSLMSFVVSDISNKLVKRNSAPTFTTSTLQQDASSKLGFSPSQTMRIAQGLYEGKTLGDETVGLITYMRTDSTRLAESFISEANRYILNNYGNKYVGGLKIKNQKNMQDAHEGIRPTSIDRTPDLVKPYLTNDEYKLYNLIYKRTLASLMAPASFNQTKILFNNTRSMWSITGQQLVFDGYLKVYGKTEEDENSLLPAFKLGDSFNSNEINILDKETLPPSRYTEASLIKDMEDKGIGRPSTYAQTILTLKERKYVNLEKKILYPTEQGILTVEKLDEFFSDIINVKYTANMETGLDNIASGNKDKLEELSSFYEAFVPLFEEAKDHMEATYPIPTDEICPDCGNILVIRNGKYGEFVSCSNYPNCKFIKKDEEAVDDNVDTNILCPVCGKAHLFKKIAKTGKNKGHVFYACGNFPKCKTVYNDEPTYEVCSLCGSMMLIDEFGNLYCSKHCEDNIPNLICPECKKGNIVKRVANRGKNKGHIFYACSNYPSCKTIFTSEPTGNLCPTCNSIMLKDDNGCEYCYKQCGGIKPIEDEVICPTCGKGHMIKRVASKGKNKGNVFYGCSNFPRCKNIMSEEEYNKLS